MKIDLTGHVAVVTGAAGELGRVIARTLGQCGAAVGVHYFRGAERANALRAGFGRRGQGPGAMRFWNSTLP